MKKLFYLLLCVSFIVLVLFLWSGEKRNSTDKFVGEQPPVNTYCKVLDKDIEKLEITLQTLRSTDNENTPEQLILNFSEVSIDTNGETPTEEDIENFVNSFEVNEELTFYHSIDSINKQTKKFNVNSFNSIRKE